MWNSKSCPRCKGDIYIEEEVGIRYEKCLQCGFEREIVKKPSIKRDWSAIKETPLSFKAV